MRFLVILLAFLIVLSGCSTDDKLETKDYKNTDFAIEFKYPLKWTVTDKSMGQGVMWLIISTTEFKILEGSKWPYVNIYGFKPNDMEIINKRLTSALEYNKGEELNKSDETIGGRDAIKYETNEINDGTTRGKLVYYVINDKDLSLMIEFLSKEEDPAKDMDKIDNILRTIKL